MICLHRASCESCASFVLSAFDSGFVLARWVVLRSSSVLKQQYQAMFGPDVINALQESSEQSRELDELLEIISTTNIDSLFKVGA